MNIVLWILQVLLALAFLMAGIMKVTRPIEALAKNMGWVKSVSSGFVRFIGIAEILAGVGLILPGATGILAWLTPLAAVGIIIIMVGAVVLHTQRGETKAIPVVGAMLVLALVIVVGRFAIQPF